jgi:hypothetical protein
VRRNLAFAVVVLLAAAPPAWALTIKGTKGPDRIAVHGNDIRDTVSCGAGRDVVTADLADRVAADCEVISRRLSRDATTDFEAQHETQVEPDSFSFGRTIVTTFQNGRFAGEGGAARIGWATSRDAGKTWRAGVLPTMSERVSDPVVAYDVAHRVWLISLLGIDNGGVDVLLARSPDGIRWSAPQIAVDAASSGDGYDKEWIACDNWATSPYRGRCYLSYLAVDSGRIETRWSANGGVTWSEPVGNSAGTPAQALINGAIPVPRPDGSVVVAFLVIAPIAATVDDNWMAASRSTDGGLTFSPPVRVSELRDSDVLGMRAPPLPTLDVDAAGRLYFAWPDCRFRSECNATDVILATSPNGVAWAPPVRVPTASVQDAVDSFLPALAVAPATRGAGARLALAYYSLQQPSGCALETCPGLNAWAITSENGGTIWSRPQRLNAVPMRLSWLADGGLGKFVGDYISTSWVGGRPIPVFAIGSAPVFVDRLRQSIFAATTGVGPAQVPVRSRGAAG